VPTAAGIMSLGLMLAFSNAFGQGKSPGSAAGRAASSG
jgi:hypothetical protein